MEGTIVNIKVYAWAQGLPVRERQKAPRVYFCPDTETVAEHLEGRRCRPSVLYRKLLPDVVRQAPAASGMSVFSEDAVFVWSQRARCSCGCSPGFIARGGWHAPVDVHVTVDAEGHEFLIARQAQRLALREIGKAKPLQVLVAPSGAQGL